MPRCLLLVWSLLPATACAGDWPEFRGPTGDGHYTGPTLPTEWGPDKNVAWKTPVRGKGWSSPITWKGKVYLTAAESKSDGDSSLRAICVDTTSGKIEWDVEALSAPAAHARKIHTKNSPASPTPTTDGERLYVHFGHMGTAALDLKGKVLWTRTTIYEKPVHGNGGSPVLVDDKLVFSCDALDKQAVVALDAKTGKTIWETPRPVKASKPFAFSTPTVFDAGGKKQILSVGSDIVMALEPAAGKIVWQSKFSGYSVIPKPVVGQGAVFLSTGYDRPEVRAIKLGGQGDVTRENGVWVEKKGGPNTPSMILDGNELYMVSDAGLMTCLDAKTGQQIWQERLKGQYSASPILADGKIYLTSETGQGTVVEASRKFNKLTESDLGEKTFASFAAAGGALYVRTESQLYKFVAR
jgi:outer membrane protein assembly factor BamB